LPSPTSIWRAYRQRLVRKGWQLRAFWRKSDLKRLHLRAPRAQNGAIYAFCVLRNESLRLPHFLDYYRNLGVEHFFIVDNGSADGSTAYLAAQEDVSLWYTEASYRAAHFGVDWLNHLLSRFGHENWCLTVDCDELLVYPHADTRGLRALTDWLDTSSLRSMPAMLLDMYPEGTLESQSYAAGQDPLSVLTHYDAANYVFHRDAQHRHLWIQGGPRLRLNFADQPRLAPALNKIPLVRWRWGYVYISSTHLMLPRVMNITYDEHGGELVSGALLHTKFLPDILTRAQEETDRGQHYDGGREYQAYGETLVAQTLLYSSESSRYVGWAKLEDDGLISSGGWA